MITLELALTPRLPPPTSPAVYVLIDVLRATSAIVTMLDRGARRVVLVADERGVAAALRGAAAPFVCAENHDGSPAPGVDYSPSLSALAGADLHGRDIVLRSTNGTVAACALIDRPGFLLVGGLLNATATMRAAVALAPRAGMRIVLVCAGRESANVPCLDDAYCAGAMIDVAVALLSQGNRRARLRDSAQIGMAVYRQAGSPHTGLKSSESAEVLRRIGCEADIALAARRDDSRIVAACATGREPGLVEVGCAPVMESGVYSSEEHKNV